MSFINTRDVIGDQATLDGLVAHTISEFKDAGVNTLRSYAFYCNSGLQYIEMPGITSGSAPSAFTSCSQLQSVILPNITRFDTYMFANCSMLNYISAPNVITGGVGAFISCYSLRSVCFPKMSVIAGSLFRACILLSDISFSTRVTDINREAFARCKSLQRVSFENGPTLIFEETFQECTALTEATLLSATTIRAEAFLSCSMLRAVSVPNVTNLYNRAFSDAPVYKLVLPKVANIQLYAITSATEVDIGANVTIAQSAFYKNTNLFALILRHTSMTTLQNINALVGTPIEARCGKIYVPSELVSIYQAGTNWVTYAQQIDSIDNYTDVAPIGVDTITDDWETILSNNNYATDYALGDTKWLKTSIGYMLMQIVAFNKDELADNSGNAHITWLSTGYYFFDSNTSNWAESSLRLWLRDKLMPTFDITVRNEIKTVKKTYRVSYTTYTTEDKIWVPSSRELYGTQYGEDSGCDYADFFTDNSSRIKYKAWTQYDAKGWIVRTAERVVSTDGSLASGAVMGYGVVFGFCT